MLLTDTSRSIFSSHAPFFLGVEWCSGEKGVTVTSTNNIRDRGYGLLKKYMGEVGRSISKGGGIIIIYVLDLALNNNTKWSKIILFSFALVTLSHITISVIHQPSVLFQPRLEKFSFLIWNWKELPSLSISQMCANYCYKIAWPTPMGSWKLNDPPLPMQELKNWRPTPHLLHPPPPQIFFTYSLRLSPKKINSGLT